MEPSLTPSSANHATPAPYGSACENCSRAKCRCMRRAGGGSCERCHRLNKGCRPPAAVRKRVTKRISKSRTAQIEQKLDGLISMLNPGAATSTVSPSIPQGSGNSSRGDIDPTPAVVVDANLEQSSISPGEAEISESPYAPSSINYGGPEITPDEAEECLNHFQTYKLKYFPFYDIPSTMTAQQLHRERPFFWRCITSVSCRSMAKQIAITEDVRRLIAQNMVMEHNRNLDMLLGILVIMGWPGYQILNKPFMGLYAQLAVAIVCDLGLNRPIQTEPPRAIQSFKMTPNGKWTPSVRSTEERRAVLGCYVITSTIATYLQKVAALSWTPHLDDCVRVLVEEDSCSNDKIMIQLVRSQLIAEKASQIPRPEADDGVNSDCSQTPLLAFCLKGLESQLEEFKSQIPTEVQHDEVVLLHCYSTESFVHELALLSKGSILSENVGGFNQLHNLCACLQSVKAWFDLLLSMPPGNWGAFPFTIFSQMSRLLFNLFRLTTFEDPAWDKNLVRSSFDLFLVLDGVIGMMKEASQQTRLINDHPEDDVFMRGARMMHYLKQSWEGSLLPDAPALAGDEQAPLEGVASEYMHLPPSFPMDLFDEALMVDIWSSLDCA